VIKSDKCMGLSQLLGGHKPGLPPPQSLRLCLHPMQPANMRQGSRVYNFTSCSRDSLKFNPVNESGLNLRLSLEHEVKLPLSHLG